MYGPDGAYWFVEAQGGRVGRIDTNGVITEYAIPSGYCVPVNIVVGPDMNLWFTEAKFNQIGRVMTNGTIKEFPLPSWVFGSGLTLGPDGRIWVLDFGGTYVPGTTTNGGVLALTIGTNGPTATNYYNAGLTVQSRPANITTGSDGNLYFTEQLTGRIARITTAGVITESPLLATNCQPFDIVSGPDGALWFTEANSNKLGRMDTSFNLTEFALATNGSGIPDTPVGLIVGPDSNFWYTDMQAGAIGRAFLTGSTIKSSNVVLYYTPTVNSWPKRLATGPDGGIWFGEFTGNAAGVYQNFIGKFVFPVPLNIRVIPGPDVVVSWSTNATTNYVLQSATNVPSTNWMNVTNFRGIMGSNYTITNPAAGPMLFYRLKD